MREMPSDVMAEEFDGSKFSYKPNKHQMETGIIYRGQPYVLAAKQPLIYAGSAVLRPALHRLIRVAGLLSAPVMTTLGGKVHSRKPSAIRRFGGFLQSRLGIHSLSSPSR